MQLCIGVQFIRSYELLCSDTIAYADYISKTHFIHPNISMHDRCALESSNNKIQINNREQPAISSDSYHFRYKYSSHRRRPRTLWSSSASTPSRCSAPFWRAPPMHDANHKSRSYAVVTTRILRYSILFLKYNFMAAAARMFPHACAYLCVCVCASFFEVNIHHYSRHLRVRVCAVLHSLSALRAEDGHTIRNCERLLCCGSVRAFFCRRRFGQTTTIYVGHNIRTDDGSMRRNEKLITISKQFRL